MWYNEEHELLQLKIANVFTKSDVSEMRDNLFTMLEGKPYRQLIVTLEKSAKVEDRETRSNINQALVDADISDVVFIGGGAANRMIAKVLLKTGVIKTKGDFFKEEEEGIKWLKNRR